MNANLMGSVNCSNASKVQLVSQGAGGCCLGRGVQLNRRQTSTSSLPPRHRNLCDGRLGAFRRTRLPQSLNQMFRVDCRRLARETAHNKTSVRSSDSTSEKRHPIPKHIIYLPHLLLANEC